jgi:hypothetical protein
MSAGSAFDDFRLTVTSGKRQAIIAGKLVDAHKPDVMAVTGVLRTRIPQTHN